MKPNLAETMSAAETLDDGEDAPASERSESGDQYVQAAQVMIDAIGDGDAESLADALKSFCKMHSADGGSSGAPGKPSLTVHLMGGHKE